MKFRSKQLLSVWIGMILILAVASSAAAGRFGRSGQMPFTGKGIMGLKTFIELNLTENQKADVLKIIDTFMGYRDLTREKMQQAGSDMAAVLAAETFDEEQAREAFRKATALREDLFVQRAKMMAELKAILAPEQLELLKLKRAQRQEKFKSRVLSRFQESSR